MSLRGQAPRWARLTSTLVAQGTHFATFGTGTAARASPRCPPRLSGPAVFSRNQEPVRPVAHPPTPGWQAETRETLRLAGPLALANLLQMLTYAIDVVFIARLGADQLAASALAVALFGLVLWSLQSLTGAVAPIMAAELGARGPALRPVRRAMRMALWLALVVSLGGMGVCALLGPLMRATGQQPHIAAMATGYMNVLLWSAPLMIVAGVLRNFVATLGRPVFATMITALGIGVNALGNWAFIYGRLGAPEMGLPGAAVATFLTSVAVVAMYA
ncbi:MAG: hypothetical protein KDE15_13865, partial [Erythrobacter sp.]|nr:hypothetical protein [Erythrobacter sp.]